MFVFKLESNQKGFSHFAALKFWKKDVSVCLLAMAAAILVGWAQNGIAYAAVASYFGVARELNSLFAISLYIAIFLVAWRRPALLDCRLVSALAAFSAVSSACILWLAVGAQDAAMTLVGLFLFSVGHVWGTVMLGVALCSLSSFKATASAAALGAILGDFLQLLVPELDLGMGMVSLGVLGLTLVVLTYRPAAKFFTKVRESDSAADLQLANPQSFLSPTSALFGCILLFGVASGFGLTLNEMDNAPAGMTLFEPLALLLACWFVFRGDEKGEDHLFSFAVMLVIAGFVVAPFTVASESSITNGFIRIGTSCFSVLTWLVLASIGRQNRFALLPAICVAVSARTLGVLVGAVSGHSVNALAYLDGHMADIITAAALFAFIAFLWLVFRSFSFAETIKGIEPSVDGRVSVLGDAIDSRCAEIGLERGLTEREIEIFGMLARGRNGSFIQEHYTVSRNTVKTHVKHIYRKLDIHSQQQLIDLMEGRAG